MVPVSVYNLHDRGDLRRYQAFAVDDYSCMSPAPCISGQRTFATFRFLSLIFVLFWQGNQQNLFGFWLVQVRYE